MRLFLPLKPPKCSSTSILSRLKIFLTGLPTHYHCFIQFVIYFLENNVLFPNYCHYVFLSLLSVKDRDTPITMEFDSSMPATQKSRVSGMESFVNDPRITIDKIYSPDTVNMSTLVVSE